METFWHLNSLRWTAVQGLAACLGLLGLAYYCWETYRLRRAAQLQTEAAYRPVIIVTDEHFPKVFLKNIGTGPALNVKYRFAVSSGRASDRHLPELEVGKVYEMGELMYFLLVEGQLLVEYESVSGIRYLTRGIWRKDEQGTLVGPVTLKIDRIH